MYKKRKNARVVELVVTSDLGSGAARRESSSLSLSTKCGYSSIDRASPFQGEGCGFEPHYPLKSRENQ